MKILFLGTDWVGSNARSLADGFSAAGHDVRLIDITQAVRPQRYSPDWLSLKMRGAPSPRQQSRLFDTAAKACDGWFPDLLLCFKTVALDQANLLSLPAAVRVHYSPDDASNLENISEDYLSHESGWDMIFTTKRHNIPEISSRSGVTTHFVWSAYDPNWHHRMARRSPQQWDIGFVGNYRPDRQALIQGLARQYGPAFAVFGNGWTRIDAGQATVQGPVYGEDFSATVAQIRANLVLLNSDNRDTHTCRSFEVPAAGGLFVGERTPEHEELIEHGTEGLLFSSIEELEQHLDYVRNSPSEISRLARAGWRRITTGGHTYRDRAMEMSAIIGQEARRR